MKKYTIEENEMNTILAALRTYQQVNSEFKKTVQGREIQGIATNGDTETPLDNSAIDVLCERLNIGDDSDCDLPPDVADSIRCTADRKYCNNDDIDIDSDAPLSKSDYGCWVQGWLYVAKSDMEDDAQEYFTEIE